MALSVEERRVWIEPGHPQLSIHRQCARLGLRRGSLYSKAVSESAEHLQLMRWLDEPYTATPFYGIRRLTARLLRTRGLEAIYPKRRLSQPAAGHEIDPYLLRGVTVDRVTQVWSADITYVRLAAGYVYLVAVMAQFSRYVLSWALSITMDVAFCVEALDQALSQGQPEIVNTDQGAQFTSQDFTARLKKGGVRISMDGRGRALDHVCVERLWRRVKAEEIYVRDDQGVWDARQSLARYFAFYNGERLPQALGYPMPAAVYHGCERGLNLVRAKGCN